MEATCVALSQYNSTRLLSQGMGCSQGGLLYKRRSKAQEVGRHLPLSSKETVVLEVWPHWACPCLLKLQTRNKDKSLTAPQVKQHKTRTVASLR